MDIAQSTSQSVREETAELASWALSAKGNTPPQHVGRGGTHDTTETCFPKRALDDACSQTKFEESSRPGPILEGSEASSGHSSRSSSRSHGRSALTDMLRRSTQTVDPGTQSEDEGSYYDGTGRIVTVRQGIISQPTERTTLLLKKAAYRSDTSPGYGSIQDLESYEAGTKASSGLKHSAIPRKYMPGSKRLGQSARGEP